MKESWSLFTVRKHWVKPALLDFNDGLKEKAEAHDLLKNTAIKAKTEDTIIPVIKSKYLSKAFAANAQHKSNFKPQQSSPSTSISRCIVCKGCGNAVSVWKRPPRREPRLWLRQSSVFLVCVISICSGSAKVPVNVEKMVATATITLYFTELKVFFTAKPSINYNINTSKSNAGTSWPSTSQQQPSKTTTLSSVTDVKVFLQVTEPKLSNTFGINTTALVLCDTACINSWVFDNLAARLGLKGTTLKLIVKGINTEDLIDTKVVLLTVTPHKDQVFEAFTVRLYVRETLNIGRFWHYWR